MNQDDKLAQIEGLPSISADQLADGISVLPVSTLAQSLAGLTMRPLQNDVSQQTMLNLLANAIPNAPIVDLKDVLAFAVLAQTVLSGDDVDPEIRMAKSAEFLERIIQALEASSGIARETFTGNMPLLAN